MPYDTINDIPDTVGGSKKRRRMWMHVFNSEYASRIKAGDTTKEAERRAFAAAWAAVKDVKVYGAYAQKAVGTKKTGFVRAINGPFKCSNCEHYKNASRGYGECQEPAVNDDPQLAKEAHTTKGFLIVAVGDCCNEFEPVKKEKNMKGAFLKFIPFAKVDAQKREVWGIVTAELPDKDEEVCDYEGSKPYYQAVIDEMSKATNGGNLFPLREMHGLSAAGKCIDFDFRDAEKEIFMGFKVVDDEAWQKVEEQVYTGFSHGGSVVGKMVPDPTFEGCMRYIANPSEISLVDNPCLAEAHFAYVNKTGQIELRKFKKIVPLNERNDRLEIAKLQKAVKRLIEQLAIKTMTKHVAGEDLESSSFLIVGNKNDVRTWQLPVRFDDDATTEKFLRSAIVRLDGMNALSKEERNAAEKTLGALCADYEIDVKNQRNLFRAVQNRFRVGARIIVNKLSRTVMGGNIGLTLATLDNDLGRLQKGMSEVSRLAELIQYLTYLVYDTISEQRWEEDTDSPLPDLLEQDVSNLLDSLLRMVEEESEELRTSINDFRQRA